jgi:alkylated DNA repair dioxygenase AlkB
LTADPQLRLFGSPKPEVLPEGFTYEEDILSLDEERELVRQFADLPFKEFEYQGFLGKRRVVSFGWRYDFNTRELKKAGDIPEFMLPLRTKVAGITGLASDALQHMLVTEYAPGAGIGWHKDRPEFDDVIGISLLGSCVFRLRRKMGAKWERASLIAMPRSFYLIRGAARNEWQHSIPPVDSLRYSITFRTFKGSKG